MLSLKKKPKTAKGKAKPAAKNWYEDRHQVAVFQRNLLFFITLGALGALAVASFVVRSTVLSKSIDPYVIQIEDKTGITKVIRPLDTHYFSGNEALMRYFLSKYIIAREGYNIGTYKENYYTVTRLLSTPSVYYEFTRTINQSSLARLGNKSKTVTIKSMRFMQGLTKEGDQTAQIRFVVKHSGSGESNYVLTINYKIADLKLTDTERQINPIGFQVTGYDLQSETF